MIRKRVYQTLSIREGIFFSEKKIIFLLLCPLFAYSLDFTYALSSVWYNISVAKYLVYTKKWKHRQGVTAWQNLVIFSSKVKSIFNLSTVFPLLTNLKYISFYYANCKIFTMQVEFRTYKKMMVNVNWVSIYNKVSFVWFYEYLCSTICFSNTDY